MRYAGLPLKVAIYETLLGLAGLFVFEAIVEVIRINILPESAHAFVRAIQILALTVAAIELTVLNRRLLRHTTIYVHDGVFEFSKGRWLNTTCVTRLKLIVSVEVTQGPLLRVLGLGRITLRSITRVPEIPPLPINVARCLQTQMTTHIALHEPPSDGTGEGFR